MTLTTNGKPDLAAWNHACKVALAELPDRDAFEESARKHNAERRELVEDPTLGRTREEQARVLPEWASAICETVGAKVGWVQWYALGGLDENYRIKSIFPGVGNFNGVTFDKWLAHKYNWSDNRLWVEFDNYICEIFDLIDTTNDVQITNMPMQPSTTNAIGQAPAPNDNTASQSNQPSPEHDENSAMPSADLPTLQSEQDGVRVTTPASPMIIGAPLQSNNFSAAPSVLPTSSPDNQRPASLSDIGSLAVLSPDISSPPLQNSQLGTPSEEDCPTDTSMDEFPVVAPTTPSPQAAARDSAEESDGVEGASSHGVPQHDKSSSTKLPQPHPHLVRRGPAYSPLELLGGAPTSLGIFVILERGSASLTTTAASSFFPAVIVARSDNGPLASATARGAQAIGIECAAVVTTFTTRYSLQSPKIYNEGSNKFSTGHRAKRRVTGQDDTPTRAVPSRMQSSPLLPSLAYPTMMPGQPKTAHTIADAELIAWDAQIAARLQKEFDDEGRPPIDLHVEADSSTPLDSASITPTQALADPCADDELVARRLQEALDGEGKDKRKRRTDVMRLRVQTAAKTSRINGVPYALAGIGAKLASWTGRSPGDEKRTPMRANFTTFGPLLSDLAGSKDSESTPNANATPFHTLAPFEFNLDDSSSPSLPAQTASRLKPALRALSVISIHSSSSLLPIRQASIVASPCSTSPSSVISIRYSPKTQLHAPVGRTRVHRYSTPGRVVPSGGTGVDDAISISSDSDVEQPDPKPDPKPDHKRARGKISAQAFSVAATTWTHDWFAASPDRTALLDAPFYGMPMDGKDLYQPDIHYPWEDSSSSSEEFNNEPPVAAGSLSLKAQPKKPLQTSMIFSDLNLWCRLWPRHYLHRFAQTPRDTGMQRSSSTTGTLPITKMVCCDHNGTVTVRQHFPVCRVFEVTGVECFHYWNSRSMSWERKTLSSLLLLSMKEDHTIILRMTWVRHCPEFDKMLSKVHGSCLFFGPCLPTPPGALTIPLENEQASHRVMGNSPCPLASSKGKEREW
ncbi:hypothetical protein C8Q78DRAFT_1081029 [Trametes maxima]|nr:hypothetical protein C8Q78DRAFT_1081029 [Trametes maxima]